MSVILTNERACFNFFEKLRSIKDGGKTFKDTFKSFSKKQMTLLKYNWGFCTRAEQLPPEGEAWRYWLLLAGRGFGKTRTGAEWIKSLVQHKKARRIALIGPTAADVRDVMIEGESGLIAISPPYMRPVYQPSKRRVVWPNGAMAFAYSADEPDRLRGPQHDALWADELAAWRYPSCWDMAMMGLRLGENPRAVITTTPRPRQFIKDLIDDPLTHVTRGSTFDNQANLPKAFLDQILKRYEGTALGAQEIHAEVLDKVPGVLWSASQLRNISVDKGPASYDRILVAIDPAVTNGTTSDETGIVVVGRKGVKGYVIDDLSGHFTPERWAQEVKNAYHKYEADLVVAETNQGGDLIESVLKVCEPTLDFKKVHAITGKVARAQPIAALYAQGKIHHIGKFKKLEEQMCTCDLTDKSFSPDRIDALVWGFTELFLTKMIPNASISLLSKDLMLNIK